MGMNKLTILDPVTGFAEEWLFPLIPFLIIAAVVVVLVVVAIRLIIRVRHQRKTSNYSDPNRES